MGFGKRGKHDHEAGSQLHHGAARCKPRPPFRLYVSVHRCRYFWEHGVPVSWPDMNLPHQWHLSLDRVPVQAVPNTDRARLAEIHRRRAQLPANLRRDPAYDVDSPN